MKKNKIIRDKNIKLIKYNNKYEIIKNDQLMFLSSWIFKEKNF